MPCHDFEVFRAICLERYHLHLDGFWFACLVMFDQEGL